RRAAGRDRRRDPADHGPVVDLRDERDRQQLHPLGPAGRGPGGDGGHVGDPAPLDQAAGVVVAAMADVLYRGCALIDHATRSLAPDMAVLVAGGRIGWLGPAGDAPDPGPGAEVVDAGG